MTEELSHPSHAMRWTLGVLALLLLYVLSWGPVMGFYDRGTSKDYIPRWAVIFYQPIRWIGQFEPIGSLLQAYHVRWAIFFWFP